MKREQRKPTRADVTKPPIDLYTDGGCKGNPGVGGWPVVIYDGPTPMEFSGSERHTTNNQMELRTPWKVSSGSRPRVRCACSATRHT